MINMQYKPPQITTPRLRLRPVNVDDSGFFLELLNDEAFIRYIGDRNVRTNEQAVEYLRNAVEKTSRNGEHILVVTLAADGASVGVCTLLKRESLPAPDIGFAFLPRYRGNGYGYEAALATLEYAQTSLGMKKIVAVTDPENHNSIALLGKLGLKLDSRIHFEGSPKESLLFIL